LKLRSNLQSKPQKLTNGGKQANNYMNEDPTRNLGLNQLSEQALQDVFEKAFLETNNLVYEQPFDTQFSGTTGACLLVLS
jgi:hypothetical protein